MNVRNSRNAKLLTGLACGALLGLGVGQAAAQQTIAPPVNPAVVPPVPAIPLSPPTPVTPLAGRSTAAPTVPERIAPPAPPIAAPGLNPAMVGGNGSTPLSGPPVNPLPGHANTP